ncbi:MAG: isocitrate lyase/PEP mutase family protein [Burkholderiaceae bacterium]|nr:isocitrate lyase/PEP mutase family protein [Burkholderiaceae bacterium]
MTASHDRLRRILAGERCVTAASVFDPVSARIADHIGFEVGVMGGSVASFAVLGDPDLVLITLSELAEQTRRVCRAGRLCVVVDADHGYGNALNVMRTVQELQAAGAAAITIEDTMLPRGYGVAGRAPALVSLEEGLGKMKAALDARAGAGEDRGPLILARTSAAGIAGVDDAIRRLRAYDATGVDGLFVAGLRTRAELDRIADAVTLPLVLGGCHENLADRDYLASRGVRLWLGGHQAFAAAVQAIHATLGDVHAGAAPSQLRDLAPGELMMAITRTGYFERKARKYLEGEDE